MPVFAVTVGAQGDPDCETLYVTSLDADEAINAVRYQVGPDLHVYSNGVPIEGEDAQKLIRDQRNVLLG